MATGTGSSSIPSQLSRGGYVNDERCLTHKVRLPESLERKQHAVHDMCDGVQSDSQAALFHQCEASNFEEEADVKASRSVLTLQH